LCALSADAAGRLYLEVAFAQKDEAKRLGARWDADAKKWYAPSADTPAAATFSRSAYTPAAGAVGRSSAAAEVAGERVYLVVPFAEKEEAKRLGARWDAVAKKWYALSADAPAAKTFGGGAAAGWQGKTSNGQAGDWDSNDASGVEREQHEEM
jgi:hypothetical protein